MSVLANTFENGAGVYYPQSILYSFTTVYMALDTSYYGTCWERCMRSTSVARLTFESNAGLSIDAINGITITDSAGGISGAGECQR